MTQGCFRVQHSSPLPHKKSVIHRECETMFKCTTSIKVIELCRFYFLLFVLFLVDHNTVYIIESQPKTI